MILSLRESRGMGDVFGDGKAGEKIKEIIGGLLTMNKNKKSCLFALQGPPSSKKTWNC